MKKTLISEIIAAAVVAIGMSVAPTASGAIIEDFEGYTTLNGAVTVDPADVGGSGWTRGGVGDSDWEVLCCGDSENLTKGTLPHFNTFDGSNQALFLRRANNAPPGVNDENYDFALPASTSGTVSFQVNPGSAGNPMGAFNVEVRDSAGTTMVALRHSEKGHVAANGTGDWIVYSDAFTTVIADGKDDGANSSRPAQIGMAGFPDAWGRWFDVTVSWNESTFDVVVNDIGPHVPSFYSSNAGPTDNIVSVLGTAHAGSLNIDQLRLSAKSGNGGSNEADPTAIDNIALTVVSVPGGGGPPIVDDAIASSNIVVEATAGIGFQSEVGVEFRLQSTPDLVSSNYTDTGVYVIGNGGGMVLFDPTGTSSAKNYRVMKE